MRDRTIRRRRLTLLACVIASLVLITAYFGESGGGGGLHGAQRGVVDVLSPLQEGANRALKPARDFVGWFGDTLDAKGERDDLRKERDELRKTVAELQAQRLENEQLRALVDLKESGVGDYGTLSARVISRSTNAWFSTLVINKGSGEGVREDQAVVGDGALVGKVESVGSTTATVKLITDDGFAASATTERGEAGLVEPSVGSRTTLVLDLVSSGSDVDVRKGDDVLTAGTASDSDLRSLFPAGIPIGKVRSIDEGEGPLDREVRITPAADLDSNLDVVQVLTRGDAEPGARASVEPGRGR